MKIALWFFLSLSKGKQIVGTVEVIGEHRPDPTDKSERSGMVEIKAIETAPKYVSLAEIKANPTLSDFALIKQV